MKIYTKKGDFGETDLLKKRVFKDDLRIEVNGTIDRVLAYVSLAKQLTKEEEHSLLNAIYDHLSTISYEMVLADGTNILLVTDINYLEHKIDEISINLPKLTGFIRFEKNFSASVLNLLRVSVRDLERKMVKLAREETINSLSLQYVNRLSDLVFVLARKYNENIES